MKIFKQISISFVIVAMSITVYVGINNDNTILADEIEIQTFIGPNYLDKALEVDGMLLAMGIDDNKEDVIGFVYAREIEDKKPINLYAEDGATILGAFGEEEKVQIFIGSDNFHLAYEIDAMVAAVGIDENGNSVDGFVHAREADKGIPVNLYADDGETVLGIFNSSSSNDDVSILYLEEGQTPYMLSDEYEK